MEKVTGRFEKEERNHIAKKYDFDKRRSSPTRIAIGYDLQTATQNQTQNQTETNLTNFKVLRGKEETRNKRDASSNGAQT